MNLTQIVFEARSLFAEPLADFVDDNTEIIPWINEGYRIWVITTKSNVVKFPVIPSVSGTREYALPSDCLMTNHILYNNGKLIPVDFEEVVSKDYWATQTGTVTNFYQERNGYFSLFRVPGENGVSIQVIGSQRPTPMVAGTDIPAGMPEDYHHALAIYAAYKDKLKDEEPQSAQQFYNEFMALAKRYFLELQKQVPDRRRLRDMKEFRLDRPGSMPTIYTF